MKKLIPVKKSFSLFGKTYGYLRRSTNPIWDHAELKRQWGEESLRHIGIDVQKIGEVCQDSSVLFVGNHISYLDIPLLMSQIFNISFVAKEEIASWPLFGNGAKAAQTIFVKREDKTNRQQSRLAISRGLNEGKRIVLFPSGTTSLTETKDWRRGAFEIAQENNCLIQPFRLTYSPLRSLAYIDDDSFLSHLTNLFRLQSMSARIEFHRPVRVTEAAIDCLHWQTWAREKSFHQMPF